VSGEKLPKDVLRHSDGQPIIVLRPLEREKVLALSKVAIAHNSEDALSSAMEGEHVFLGYLVRRGGKLFAVDEHGEHATEPRSGDIFTAMSDLEGATVVKKAERG
jgi:hypothetical protein